MKSTIKTEALNNALKIIGRLVPPTSGNVTFSCKDGKNLVLASQGEGADCSVIIPCDDLKSKKDVIFAVPIDGLRNAIRGREEVNVEFTNQVFSLKHKSFSAALNTIDAIEMEAIEDEGEAKKEKPKKWKLQAEQASWLAKATRAVSLQANSMTGDFMPVSVRLDGKKAVVTCYDKHHFAYMQSKEITGDLDLTMPLDTFQAILEVFSGANFSIEMSPRRVQVGNKLVKVSLALPEIEEGSLTIDDVMHVAKEAVNMKGTDITMPTATLKSFLDSSKAVALKDRAELTAEADGGKIKMQVQTLSGKVRESLPAEGLKKKVSFKIDYGYFEEAVRKLDGDTISFKAVASEFLMFNADNLYVMVSTNQEG